MAIGGPRSDVLRDQAAGLAEVSRLLSVVPRLATGPRVVALDGPSGSGKTTLAAMLEAAFAGTTILSMDGIYPGWDGLEAGVQRVVDGVLDPWSRGDVGRLRRYDWFHDRQGQWYDVPSAPVVVLEGCGSGARACRPYLSALVWVEAETRQRQARAIARDGEGYRRQWTRWAAQEVSHFAREHTRERADVRLDTSSW